MQKNIQYSGQYTTGTHKKPTTEDLVKTRWKKCGHQVLCKAGMVIARWRQMVNGLLYTDTYETYVSK